MDGDIDLRRMEEGGVEEMKEEMKEEKKVEVKREEKKKRKCRKEYEWMERTLERSAKQGEEEGERAEIEVCKFPFPFLSIPFLSPNHSFFDSTCRPSTQS